MTPDPNLVEDLRLLEPVNPLWFWLGGAGLVLLILAVWALRARRRRPRPLPTPAAQQAAYANALAALAELLPLLTPAQSRAYAIASSHIIRHFIEGRFGIRAPFQATEEFLNAARQSPVLAPRHRELLADYLGRCDLLKFARHRGDHEDLVGLHEAAIRFVTESMAESAGTAAVVPVRSEPVATSAPSGGPHE